MSGSDGWGPPGARVTWDETNKPLTCEQIEEKFVLTTRGLEFRNMTDARVKKPAFDDAYDAAIAQMKAIHDAKRNDYTGGDADPLKNYRQSAAVIDREAHHIMLARIQEKVNRVGNLFGDTEQQVADEKVTDTLLDIANISLLILAELESR